MCLQSDRNTQKYRRIYRTCMHEHRAHEYIMSYETMFLTSRYFITEWAKFINYISLERGRIPLSNEYSSLDLNYFKNMVNQDKTQHKICIFFTSVREQNRQVLSPRSIVKIISKERGTFFLWENRNIFWVIFWHGSGHRINLSNTELILVKFREISACLECVHLIGSLGTGELGELARFQSAWNACTWLVP